MHSNKVEQFVIDDEQKTETEKIEKPLGPIDMEKFFKKYLRIKNQLFREFIAETFGTIIMGIFSIAPGAQFKFFLKDNLPEAVSFLSINLSAAFGVTISILIAGKISGAHLNPAVSLAMLLTGRMNFRRFFIYLLAQFIGTFLAAVIVFVTYLDSLKSYGSNMYDIETSGIFVPYPNKHLSSFGGFFDQMIATSILIIVILAVYDKKNFELTPIGSSLTVGFTVLIIGCSFAYNCGYPLNPVRDLGPRCFTAISGWGTKVFTEGNYFFWIPLVGPMIGAVLGTVLYLIIISINL